MFRKITESFYASPQIGVDDVARAAGMGVKLVINNRPEGESGDQTPGSEIERAARAAGLAYLAIPVGHAGFGEGQASAMSAALDRADGPVLAYCRSGTRSTLLWALAETMRGENPRTLAEAAARAGYDVSPVRTMMDMLGEGAASE